MWPIMNSFHIFHPHLFHISFITPSPLHSQAYYMSHPPHARWLDHSNNIWRGVPIMNLTMYAIISTLLLLPPPRSYTPLLTVFKWMGAGIFTMQYQEFFEHTAIHNATCYIRFTSYTQHVSTILVVIVRRSHFYQQDAVVFNPRNQPHIRCWQKAIPPEDDRNTLTIWHESP